MIRNVGVSNFAAHHLKQLQAMPNVAPISVNQFQYNPWAPEFIQETYQYCQEQGIQVTAYASLGGSLQHAETQTVQTLNDIAAAHSKSLAQIMLRWAIQSNCVVIPGTGNPKHMVENLEIYSFELTTTEMEAIHALRHDEHAKKFFYLEPPKD
jgi:diketogulonate reductase-like aldo/keto reductase